MFGARAIKRRRDKEAELKVLTPNTNSQICKYKYTNKQIQIHKHAKTNTQIHKCANENTNKDAELKVLKPNTNTQKSKYKYNKEPQLKCSLLTEKSHCFQQITFHSEKHS